MFFSATACFPTKHFRIEAVIHDDNHQQFTITAIEAYEGDDETCELRKMDGQPEERILETILRNDELWFETDHGSASQLGTFEATITYLKQLNRRRIDDILHHKHVKVCYCKRRFICVNCLT